MADMDELIKRVENLETVVYGDERLRVRSLSSQIDSLAGEIAQLNEAFEQLRQWQSSAVLYLRAAMALLGILGLNGLRELAAFGVGLLQ